MSEASIDTARRAIFGRLRSAMPAEQVAPPDVSGYYAQSLPDPAIDRVAHFIERARGWQAEVIETSSTAWPAALLSVLDSKGVKRLLAGRNTALSATLAASVSAERLCWYEQPIEQFKATLFGPSDAGMNSRQSGVVETSDAGITTQGGIVEAVDAGITTTRGGIVETGSLMVWPNGDEPRTLSLVPPLHIAVLRANELHDTLYEAMLAQRWSEQLPTNALLITGPSKTADIQRLLVYGAHGPKQLVILLIRDEQPS
ncbi:LutC/YkgG family protein [Steroidobacter sp.]|uniref:LutC/YkgG family protein n=1 Tax=Steroidobacter sp. TaxID=1978227 RepID=UPI001A60ABFE|nr:lactate utilization protein [Steroidobacter sp.]MBL8271375.1 lactate utilization protein [Steroidobacter sp.]